MKRILLVLLTLSPALARAEPTRLATCNSGKTGHVQLFVEKGDAGYVLSSTDDVEVNPRTFRGTVLRARKHKQDKRHTIYRFELSGAELQQVDGLDASHCKPEQLSAVCAIDAIEVRTAKHGPREPGDDGLAAKAGPDAVVMDNGGPQHCTVFASKVLTALLKAK